MRFTRKWVCRLDRKRRFVLPEEVRRKLDLGEFVCIELDGGKLCITKANGELARARAISRNLYEVCEMIDGLRGVTDRTTACGAVGPGSTPGEGLNPFPRASQLRGAQVKALTEKCFPQGRRFWK